MARMKLQQWGEVSQIVSALAVVVSLIYVGSEIGENTEATRGATDVSRNVVQAAKAAGEISSSIHQVGAAARETSQSSSGVRAASDMLGNLSRDLSNIAKRFKLSATD